MKGEKSGHPVEFMTLDKTMTLLPWLPKDALKMLYQSFPRLYNMLGTIPKMLK